MAQKKPKAESLPPAMFSQALIDMTSAALVAFIEAGNRWDHHGKTVGAAAALAAWQAMNKLTELAAGEEEGA